MCAGLDCSGIVRSHLSSAVQPTGSVCGAAWEGAGGAHHRRLSSLSRRRSVQPWLALGTSGHGWGWQEWRVGGAGVCLRPAASGLASWRGAWKVGQGRRWSECSTELGQAALHTGLGACRMLHPGHWGHGGARGGAGGFAAQALLPFVAVRSWGDAAGAARALPTNVRRRVRRHPRAVRSAAPGLLHPTPTRCCIAARPRPRLRAHACPARPLRRPAPPACQEVGGFCARWCGVGSGRQLAGPGLGEAPAAREKSAAAVTQ